MEKQSQPWAKSCEEVIESLNSDLLEGLSKEEAANRLIEFGANVLKVEKKISSFCKFILIFQLIQES